MFIESIKKHVASLPDGMPEKILLDFLLANCVGHTNAKPWDVIDRHLQRHGIHWRAQDFQQGLLKQSREGPMYIGSNDHGDSRGYFLIESPEDAEVMAAWYRKRIATEQQRLNHLMVLREVQWPGWKPPKPHAIQVELL